MLSVGPGTRILMAVEPVDLRRGHDGLVTLVRERYRADPYSGELYIFLGKRRDRVKILFFSAGGFVLYYKRLERGCFTAPVVPAGADRIMIDAATLTMLLDGVDLRSIKRAPRWEPTKKK